MGRIHSSVQHCAEVSGVYSTKSPRRLAGAFRVVRGLTALRSANSKIFKSQRSHACAVQQVLGVHDYGTLDDPLDAVKVQSAELRPAGAEDYRVRTLGHVIRRITVA